MMKRFMALYCKYDPDNYVGHFNHTFEAENLEAAYEYMKAWVPKNLISFKGLLEIQISEIVDRGSFKTFDTSTQNWG